MQETPETRAKLANAITQLRSQGRENEVNFLVGAYKTKYTNQPVVEQPVAKESFLTSIQPSFKASTGGATSIPKNVAKTVANIPSSARNLVRNTIAPVNPFDTQSPLNIGANILKGASDVKALATGVKDIGVGGTGKALAGGVGNVLKKGSDIYKSVGQKIYNNLEQNVMDTNSISGGLGVSTAQGISNIAEVGIEDPLLIPSIIYAPAKVRGTGITDDAISKLSGLSKVDTKLSTILPKAKAAFEPTTKALERKVVTQFEKGVKPLLNVRSTPEMVAKYKNNIVEATKVIDNNKANLSFTDDIGDVVTGKNPESLQQLSDAVNQTKKTVYNEYNALTKQSGEKGLLIKTDDIANELDTVIGNEALQISNPTAVQYAKDLKDRLSYRELTPEVTENVIKNYNESLKAFYRNPSYDSASKASIDALIVNKLREQLDNGITNLTGEKYQALKNKYGSLKTIENDVIKATLRDARKNNKGLLDFSDIFSGSDIVSGIVTLNPAQLTRGVAGRGIKEYYKYLNSPNRAVKKMFNTTEKLNQRSIPKIPATKSPMIVSENSLLQTNPSTNNPIAPSNIAINKTIPQTKLPSTAKASINKHIGTAFQVLNDPDMAVEIAKNQKTFITQTKADIVMGLKADGFTKEAQKLSTIDINKVNSIGDLTGQIEKKLNQKTGFVEGIVNRFINTPNKEGGFVINPLKKNVKIPKSDIGEMRDFLDIQTGAYKPSAKMIIDNENEVRAMVEAKFGKEVANITPRQLTTYVGKIVDKYIK